MIATAINQRLEIVPVVPSLSVACENKHRICCCFLLSLLYVCPEPVLANDEMFQIEGKDGIFGAKNVFVSAPHRYCSASRCHAPGRYRRSACRSNVVFLSIPYVCPRPVLANIRFFSIYMLCCNSLYVIYMLQQHICYNKASRQKRGSFRTGRRPAQPRCPVCVHNKQPNSFSSATVVV